MKLPPLTPGDRAPNFVVPGRENQQRMFYADATGRPIVLLACGRTDDPAAQALSRALAERAADIAAAGADLCLISQVPVSETWPESARHYIDQRGAVLPLLLHTSFGMAPARLLVLDANQRVLALPEDVPSALAAIPVPAGGTLSLNLPQPPVLVLPEVLDAAFCEWLIRIWHEGGNEEGGVSSRYGNTLAREKKRSRDHVLSNPDLIREVSETLARRLGPELQKTFCWFQPFFFDGHVILSYRDDRKDFFAAHRDNLAPGSQNRRFAMSLNLNEDFEGGELFFPEYASTLYKPPRGAACIFSCSVLHEARPVTRGQRWVLTTFFREAQNRPQK